MRRTLTKVFAVFAATTMVALPVFTQRDVKIAGLRKMPQGLTLEKARNHVIKPAHTLNIEAEKDVEAEPAFDLKKRPLVNYGGRTPKLDVGDFGRDLDSVLKNSTVGYAIEIRQNGTPIYGFVTNWAQTPNDRSLAWTGNIRMHVASVSKMLTAIGMVKVLDSKGISLDKEIIGYLPAYWSKGTNINKITFRHLLRHTSGLGVLPAVGGGTSSASDFAFMKQNISLGVPEPGSQNQYQNVNYSLMRILIPVINGDVTVNYNPTPVQARDAIWDSVTIEFYKEYMQDNVFTPAGVSNAGFAPLPVPTNSALAYAFPPGNGWNSGDLSTISGGAGWRLSVSEVLNVMNHFRRKNTIVSDTRAQQILDAGLGVKSYSTPAGTMYFKKGAYGNNGRHEQCMAYYLPDGMELVIFANSRVAPVSYSLHKLVRDIYVNSLK